MAVLSLTASHHDLDLVTLERLSSGAPYVAEATVACDAISGVVVLATCNRFEVYADVAETSEHLADAAPELTAEHAARELARAVAAHSDVDEVGARQAFTLRTGTDVVDHLFSVASGLDSVVVGEREIAGQVRRALESAHASGTTTGALERLFQAASRTSKRVSNETTLGGAGRSLVSLGLDVASTDLPPWAQVRTLLIGTGSYAGAAMAALRARGAQDVRVYSRSGRAESFARDRGAQAVTDLVAQLEDVDLVVACSGVGRDPGAASAALGHAVDAAAVLGARARAAAAAGDDVTTRPLVVLDLALTRDVAPQVADVDGVLLYDLASLKARAPQLGSGVVRDARAVVGHAAEHYLQGETMRAEGPRVAKLVREADAEIARRSAERLAELRRIAAETGTPEPDAEAVDLAVRREVRARLHEQILAVRAELGVTL